MHPKPIQGVKGFLGGFHIFDERSLRDLKFELGRDAVEIIGGEAAVVIQVEGQ